MGGKTGKFIVFEGLDGCGKTTQLSRLYRRLFGFCRPSGLRAVFVTREPSESVPGLLCRAVSKKHFQIQTESETMLFAADRFEHVTGEILPHLHGGHHVLCDRFFLSSFAYQSLEVNMETILRYNRSILERIVPDATIFLRVTPEECGRRRASGRSAEEKYETVQRAALIEHGYAKAIDFLQDWIKEILYIDGTGEEEDVAGRVWSEITRRGIFTDEDFR